MGLVAELDTEGVVRSVRNFFESDEILQPNYSAIDRYADDLVDTSAPAGDVTGIHGSSAGNATENRLVGNDEYLRAKKAVFKAASWCGHDGEIIIKEQYINCLRKWQVMRILHVGAKKTYRRLEKRSLLYFAEAIMKAKVCYKVSDAIIPNFIAENKKSAP